MTKQKLPLPPSWIQISLGDVIDYGTCKKIEPCDISGGTWVLELEDIEKDTSKLLTRLTYSERRSKSTKNCFEAGDVLYGKLRPYLNKILIADRPGVCTTEIVPLKANGAVDGSYLFYWLKHPVFLDYVAAVSYGVNMPRLGTESGRNAPFVLAPLLEQKRIADKLETVLARVDACRERLNRVPLILKRFRQSVLAAAVSGQLTADWRKSVKSGTQATENPSLTRVLKLEGGEISIPAFWHDLSLRELIAAGRPLCYGVVQPGTASEGGVPLIRVQDMDGGTVNIGALRTVSGKVDQEYKRSRVREGDLLVSIVGTIGRTAIVPRGFEGNIARAIARIAPAATTTAGWLNIWLSCDVVQWSLLSSSREVARKTLNLSELADTRVAVPALDEQHEILRRVNTLFAFADRLESKITVAYAAADRLTPALLAKAFRGELVPQDPNDEPAADLLKRLAAARESAPTGKRNSKSKSTVAEKA